MKNRIFQTLALLCLTAFLSTAIIFAACKKLPPSPPITPDSTYLSIDKTNFELNESAVDTVVHISSNTDWKLSIISGADFLSSDKTHGTGNSDIRLHIKEYTATTGARASSIKIEATQGNVAAIDISIKQKVFGYKNPSFSWAYGGYNSDVAAKVIKAADGIVMI